MKEASDRETFLSVCHEKGLPLTEERLAKLDAFEALIQVWQRRLNLIAPSTLQTLWVRHFLDSLSLLPHIPPSARTFYDLGSGAGFPGVPLSLFTQMAGTYVESNHKKATFLEEVISRLKLQARVTCARVEKLVPEQPINQSAEHATPSLEGPLHKPDLLVCRAVAPLAKLIKLIKPLRREGQTLLFLKGKQLEDEMRSSALDSFRVSIFPNISQEGYVLCLQTEEEA